jgi:hypothetical protein
VVLTRISHPALPILQEFVLHALFYACKTCMGDIPLCGKQFADKTFLMAGEQCSLKNWVWQL